MNLNTKIVAITLLSIASIEMNARMVGGQPMPKPMMMNEQPMGRPMILGMDPTNQDLLQAIKSGNIKKTSDLIKEGADVNAMSNEGSPLIVAAKTAMANPDMDNKMANIERLLLKKDANASLVGPNGMTALMYAAQGGANKTVRALLKNKKLRESTINLQDSQGNDALTYAAQAGNKETVERLLDYKEIRPTQQAVMQASTPEIKDMIQKKYDKLMEEGKLSTQPIMSAPVY